MTRQPVIESRVSGNGDDEIVPAIELIQHQLVYKRRVPMQNPRAQVACIGIERTSRTAAPEPILQ